MHGLLNKGDKVFPGPLLGMQNCRFLSVSHLMLSNGRIGLAIDSSCFYITVGDVCIDTVHVPLVAPNRHCHCIVEDNIKRTIISNGCWQRLRQMEFSHKYSC